MAKQRTVTIILTEVVEDDDQVNVPDVDYIDILSTAISEVFSEDDPVIEHVVVERGEWESQDGDL